MQTYRCNVNVRREKNIPKYILHFNYYILLLLNYSKKKMDSKKYIYKWAEINLPTLLSMYLNVSSYTCMRALFFLRGVQQRALELIFNSLSSLFTLIYITIFADT